MKLSTLITIKVGTMKASHGDSQGKDAPEDDCSANDVKTHQ